MHDHALSIAPMIQWTNTYFRQLMRLIAPKALVYTEMIALPAVLHQQPRCLAFHPMEHPIALQVGGSDREGLVEAVKIAEAYYFDEINLNLGCPSPRVQKGRFGACLMREGDHVADCIRAMKAVATIPVTVKMRLGVDELDSYEFFMMLAEKLIAAGVDKLIIHARKAWLKGLNPKQNRTIPPLNYAYVSQLKAAHPQMVVILNGQVNTEEIIRAHAHLDGVMIGRLACDNPYALAKIHQMIYPEHPILTRQAVVYHYIRTMCQIDSPLPWAFVKRPLLNMGHGLPHAKQWKMAVNQVTNGEHLLDLERLYGPLLSTH